MASLVQASRVASRRIESETFKRFNFRSIPALLSGDDLRRRSFSLGPNHQLFVSAAVAESATRPTIQSIQTQKNSMSTKPVAADLGEIKLYQYQICPFCNYAKAVLSYADLPYDAVEVNPLSKAELKWSKEYKKVPIATVAGEQINGSDEIVMSLLGRPEVRDSLQRKWDGEKMSMEEFSGSDSAKRWTSFATGDLAPLLYPNLCNTMSNSYRAFDYVNNVESFSTIQRVMIQSVGSVAMYFAASKIKKKRNISDVRKALMEALNVLENEGLDGGKKQFLSGGAVPNLGDVAVFGTLRGLEGLEVHEEVIGSRPGPDGAPSPLTRWYERMVGLVYNNESK